MTKTSCSICLCRRVSDTVAFRGLIVLVSAMLLIGPSSVLGQDAGTQEASVPSADAQTTDEPAISPILTLDQDVMFLQTKYGERVQADLARDREALAAENRRIEAELIAEEKDLTERRPALSVEEFSQISKAFDEKVQAIRAERDRKSRALQQQLEDERQRFFNEVGPVLAQIVRQRGAVAIIDRKAILLSFESIDVTSQAVEMIDDRLGTGENDALSVPSLQDTGASETQDQSGPTGSN